MWKKYFHKLHSLLRKFYGRHHDLLKHYNYLSLMTTGMFRMSNNSNTASAARETAHHSEVIFGFRVIRAAQSLVFCVVFCRSSFVPFSLAIVLLVLPFTHSNYLIKLFMEIIAQADYLHYILYDLRGTYGG